MTQKLYYKDSYIKEFTGCVLSVTVKNGVYSVELDRTAFFPDGGGQPSDTGVIGGAAVGHVEEIDGIIMHRLTEQPSFAVGDEVSCAIDWDKRFARMQAHSGEHLVSGIAHNLFGCGNVGFHMDDTLMTVDFDKYLSKEQLMQIEVAANRAVYENAKINCFFAAEKKYDKPYRSKLDNIQNPRIVEIEGYDACACCAPHLRRTGEIGIIKILSSASHRGGVRITLICGITAYKELADRYNDILTLSDMLCAPHDSVPEVLSSFLYKFNEMKRSEALHKSERLNSIADSTTVTDGNICLFVDDAGADDIRKLSVRLKDKCKGFCIVLSGSENDGYAYAVTSPCVNLRPYAAEFNSALSGRGGGKDDMLQGHFNEKKQKISDYFNSRSIE